MKNPTPQRFRKAVLSSFGVTTLIYLVTALFAVSTLGDKVEDNILTSFDDNTTNKFALAAVTFHLQLRARKSVDGSRRVCGLQTLPQRT